MKKIFPLWWCLLFIMGCADPTKDSSQENLVLVKKYLEAVAGKDFNTMESLLAENYLGLGPSVGDTTNKQLALENWKWNSENLYQSVTYEFSESLPATVNEGPAAGEWVSNWAYVTINYKDGRGPVNLWVNAVYKIENGRIARSRTFYNEADVLAQLGYRIFPPLTFPEEE